MRIKEIIIKNFKNIGINEECKIVIPEVDSNGSSDFLTIIGENNIGKSSIFEAIRLFLPETDLPSTPTIDLFPFKKQPSSEDEYMEIQFTFNGLSQSDIDHEYIKPYVYNNELIIRRRWKGPDLKDSEVPFEAYIPKRFISELDIEKTWNRQAFEAVSSGLRELYDDYCQMNDIRGGTINKGKKDDFTNYVYLNDSTLITEGDPEWFPNPNGLASKIRSIMPKVIYVPAVKLTNEEADANKNRSAANQIASALFENHLNNAKEVEKFKEALSSLKSMFDDDSKHKEVQNIQSKLSKKLQRIMDVEAHVDFEIPDVMEKLYLNSSIFLKHNDLITKPSEQGNGIQRQLILSLLELLAEQLTSSELDKEINNGEWKRGILFLIEEPEIYLHPQLQRKMRDSLVQISSHPLAQVLCTSHSENFIDLADRHQGIFLLKRGSDGTAKSVQVTDDIFNGETKNEKRNRMRMLLNFNSSTLESFFAKRVILVEGDCEVASFLAVKEKLKTKFEDKADEIEKISKEVLIIPCNGKLTQLAYYEVLKNFGIQPLLIHDLDGQGETEGNNRIILNTIGSNEFRLTHKNNFEEHIFGETWTNDKPWKATERINNNFESYEEGLMRFFKFIVGEDCFNALQLNTKELIES